MKNVSDESYGENQDSNFFFFFRKSCRLWEDVEKSCRARLAIDDNMAHYMLDNWSCKHTLGIAIPLQEWLRKSASMLRHTYVASPIILCIVNYILCTKFCTTYNFDIKVGRSENDFTS